MKPIKCYDERLCTLCRKHDIEDEDHILIKCGHFIVPRKKNYKCTIIVILVYG